jgi:hypothetical protein
VLVAGSGDSNFYDALRERLEDGIDMAEPDLLSIRSKIEEVILKYCGKIWPLYTEKARPSAQMLIGIRATDGFALLHTEGPIVRLANTVECIGFGAEFSIYQLKKLFNETMPLVEVCPIAVYVLDLAKENVQFCGGDSHIFVIPKDGAVEKKDLSYIQDNLQKFKSLALTVDGVLARASSLKMREPEYLASLLNFYETEPENYRDLSPDDVEAMRQKVKELTDRKGEQTELAFAQLVKEHGSVSKALWELLDFQKKALEGGIEWPVHLMKEDGGPVDSASKNVREIMVSFDLMRFAIKDIKQRLQGVKDNAKPVVDQQLDSQESED